MTSRTLTAILFSQENSLAEIQAKIRQEPLKHENKQNCQLLTNQCLLFDRRMPQNSRLLSASS